MQNDTKETSAITPHDAAAALGRLGGLRNTKAQQRARSENALKGGYPAGRPRPKVGESEVDYAKRLRKWARAKKATQATTSAN